MRAVVQRAAAARVLVGGEVVGALHRPGLLVLVGVTHGDSPREAAELARRLWHLRILADEDGRMNRSAEDLDAPLLVVSQFTLYADTTRGRRPSFVDALGAEEAAPLVDAVVEALRALGATVATGRFGAEMRVELVGDGPVTILLEV